MPIIAGVQTMKLPQLGTETIIPNTLNYLGNTAAGASEQSGYSFTISDVRVVKSRTGFVSAGAKSEAATALDLQNSNAVITNGTAVSQTVIGSSLTLIGTGDNILFGVNSIIYATLTVIGLDSGARVQVPIQITRTTTS
jgi:hypothetical protein